MKNILRKISVLVAAVFLLAAGHVSGAENNESPDTTTAGLNAAMNNEPDQKNGGDSSSEETRKKRLSSEMMITNGLFGVLTAAMYLAALIIATNLFRRMECRPKDLITVIGLVSVVFGTILLTLAVDTTDQLTAPMGILGAIAGYLFGAAQKKVAKDEAEEGEKDKKKENRAAT